MWTRSRSELLLVAGLLLAPHDAWADPAQPAPAASGSADDPLAPYRERFKQGMDRYREGSLAEAVGYWEPIYRELGDEKGYRLAYNLGVAYAELGDGTRAAERLQGFLDRTAGRRERGETLEPIVEREEEDAKQRLDRLTATHGRIRLEAGLHPCAVQVDAGESRLSGYVAWVSPGHHTVVFSPGTETASTQAGDVGAGALLTLTPPPPAATAATPTTPSPPLAAPPRPEPLPHAKVVVTTHPFSPAVLAASGGFALAAGIIAIPLDSNAWSLRKNALSEQQPSNYSNDRQAFDEARTQTYVAIGVGIGLAAVTAALSAWYVLDARRQDVVATPGGVAWRF